MPKKLDAEIDQLFQLPLGEFTAARNTLAKAAGKDGAAIRELAKPPVAAWAVNQLYWQRRDEYDALIAAAEGMRRTHTAVIEGKRGDLRAASRAHDQALDTALKATLDVLARGGHPVTDATRQQILNTLRALPSGDTPGRLTRVLAPGGFEMLSGIKAAAPAAKTTSGKREAAAKAPAASAKGDKTSAREKAKREAAAAAVAEAEQRARRAEFESARATRDAERAERRVREAQAAVDQAREDLARAERAAAAAEHDAAAATRARETAERKARDAESALATARTRLPS